MIEKKSEQLLEKHYSKKGSVISLLQDIQEAFGYIPEDVVFWFSDKLNIPASNFFGVATFYAQFYLKPRGKNIITACCGTACHVKGSAPIINKVREKLHIPEGGTTSSDGKFTVESVACIGACSIAPVIIVNKKVHGKMTSEKTVSVLNELETAEKV